MSGSFCELRNRSTDRLKRWFSTVQTFFPGRFFLTQRLGKKPKSNINQKCLYQPFGYIQGRIKDDNLDVIMGSLRKDIFDLLDNIPNGKSPVTLLFKLNSLETNIRETCNIQDHWITHPNFGRENLKVHEKYVLKLIEDIIDDVFDAYETMEASFSFKKFKERQVHGIVNVLDILKSEVTNMINVLIATFDSQLISKKDPLYEAPAPYSKEDKVYSVRLNTNEFLMNEGSMGKSFRNNPLKHSASAPVWNMRKTLVQESTHSEPNRSANHESASKISDVRTEVSDTFSNITVKTSDNFSNRKDISSLNTSQIASTISESERIEQSDSEESEYLSCCNSECEMVGFWGANLFKKYKGTERNCYVAGRGDVENIERKNYCFKAPKLQILHPEGNRNLTNKSSLSKKESRIKKRCIAEKDKSEIFNADKVGNDKEEKSIFVKKREKRANNTHNYHQRDINRSRERAMDKSTSGIEIEKAKPKPILNRTGRNGFISDEKLKKCFNELNRKNSNFVRYKTMAFIDDINSSKEIPHQTSSAFSVGTAPGMTLKSKFDTIQPNFNDISKEKIENLHMSDGYKCVTIPLKTGIVGVTLKKVPSSKYNVNRVSSKEEHTRNTNKFPDYVHCYKLGNVTECKRRLPNFCLDSMCQEASCVCKLYTS